eukprot:scaffold1.g5523.t1
MAEQLAALGYRDLQQEAKARGVKATGTKAEIIERILQAGGSAAQPAEERPTPVQRVAATKDEAAGPAAAKTPRAVRANGTQAKSPAQAKTPAPPKSLGKEVLLKAAAGTPLPKGTPPPAEGAGGAATSAAKPAARRPAPRGGGRRLLLWSALLTAALAGAQVVVPYWQHQGLSEQLYAHVHRLSPVAAERGAEALARSSAAAAALRARLAAAAAPVVARAQHAAGPATGQVAAALDDGLEAAALQWARLRAAALDAAETAADQLAVLVARIKGESTYTCDGTLDASGLGALLPPGPELLESVWRGNRAQTYKASTFLFAFASEEAGAAAHARLAAAARVRDDECLLQARARGGRAAVLARAARACDHLDAGALLPDRGALQHTLAEFLRHHPKGTVLLQHAERLPPALVPVLSNALSEQGAFEHLGSAVPSRGATVLLTAQLPPGVLAPALAKGEQAFRVAAKAQFVQEVLDAAAVDTRGEDALHTQLKALRRRIDYAVPLADPALSSGEAEAPVHPPPPVGL